MRAIGRLVLRIAGFFLLALALQSLLWAAVARPRLLGSAFEHQVERWLRAAVADPAPIESSREAFEFLMPCQEVVRSLERGDLERLRGAVSERLSVQLVTPEELGARYPEGMPDLYSSVRAHDVVAVSNTPFIARVEHRGSCSDIALWGFSESYLHLFGTWIHLRTFDEWVS